MIYYINPYLTEYQFLDSVSVFKQNSNFYQFNTNKSDLVLEPAGLIPSEDVINNFFIDQQLFCNGAAQPLINSVSIDFIIEDPIEIDIDEELTEL
jgi:hypothetical protein